MKAPPLLIIAAAGAAAWALWELWKRTAPLPSLGVPYSVALPAPSLVDIIGGGTTWGQAGATLADRITLPPVWPEP